MHFSSRPCVLHAPPISFLLISSPYFVKAKIMNLLITQFHCFLSLRSKYSHKGIFSIYFGRFLRTYFHSFFKFFARSAKNEWIIGRPCPSEWFISRSCLTDINETWYRKFGMKVIDLMSRWIAQATFNPHFTWRWNEVYQSFVPSPEATYRAQIGTLRPRSLVSNIFNVPNIKLNLRKIISDSV
jgi:hypothetical protein